MTKISIHYKDASGVEQTRARVLVTPDSKATYTLMQKDCINLKWNATEKINLRIGDYVWISELGSSRLTNLLNSKYELTEPYAPKYNEQKRCWEYNVTLNAQYYKWKNMLLRMPIHIGATDELAETSFTLTDTVEKHIQVLLLNLRIKGCLYEDATGSKEYKVKIVHTNKGVNLFELLDNGTLHKTNGISEPYYKPSEAEIREYINVGAANMVQYNNTNLLDALKAIAKAWECEYWFEDEYLCLGRNDRARYVTDIAAVANAADISSSGSKGKFVTRLYAFGSSRNVTEKYRKELVFTKALAQDYETTEIDVTDTDRLLTASMFRDKVRGTETAIKDYDSQVITLNAGTNETTHINKLIAFENNYARYGNHPRFDKEYSDDTVGGNKKYYKYTEKTATSQGIRIEVSGEWSYPIERSVNGTKYVYTTAFSASDQSFHLLSDIDLVLYCNRPSGTVNVRAYGVKNDGTQTNIQTQSVYVGNGVAIGGWSYPVYKATAKVTLDSVFDASQYVAYGIELSTQDFYIIPNSTSINLQAGSFYPACKFKAKFRLPEGETELNCILNKNHKRIQDDEAKLICLDTNTGKEAEMAAVKAASNLEYTISADYLFMPQKVPFWYYRSKGTNWVVNTASQSRLMLPENEECNGKYVDFEYIREGEETARPIDLKDVVEGVEVFEDIFPHREDSITEISEVTYKEKEVDAESLAEHEMPYVAYRLKTAGTSAPNPAFSKEYIVNEGEGLHITFQSGLLNGMTFEVVYNPYNENIDPKPQPECIITGSEVNLTTVRNPDAEWFEIKWNENYGMRLPNAVLKPKVGDTFVLYGYDTSYIQDGGLYTEAEARLLTRAKARLIQLAHNDATYNVTLKAGWIAESNKWFQLGDRMRIDTASYFEPQREERVIGWNINLDIPEDAPQFIVGENARYSRLESIERSLK